MKLSILIFVMLLQSIILYAKPDPIIKIYVRSDSSISYNINDIGNITFKDFSYSNFCKFYFNNNTNFAILTYLISNISILKNQDSLSYIEIKCLFSMNGPKYNFNLKDIDSIVFKNTNILFDKLYRQIEFKISGLRGSFKYNDQYSPLIKDTTWVDSASISDKSFSLINKSNLFQYDLPDFDCQNCYNYEKNWTLNFCKYTQYVSVNSDPSTCNYEYVSLSIDSTNYIINSLYYHLVQKDHSRGSNPNLQNNKDVDEDIILSEIPFTKNSDGTLTASVNLQNTNTIQYGYNSSKYSGQGQMYTRNITDFIKLLEPLKSINISIVIRE